MKIAVIGAGVTGVATAYELARDGHQVTVYESSASVAEAGSFATGPLMSPGLTGFLSHAPWPASSRAAGLLHASHLRLQGGISASDLRWLFQWKTVANAPFLSALAAQSALTKASIQRFSEICHDEGFQVEQGGGHILLLNHEKHQAELQPHLDWLASQDLHWQALTPAEAQKLEPALFQGTEPRPALYFPEDRLANCRQFVQLQKERAQSLGVHFEMGQRALGFSSADNIEVHLAGGASPARFEHVVLCTGAQSRDLLRSLNLPMPVAQVQSYSLSASIREPLNAPRAAVTDGSERCSMVRLGNRVRITGGGELGPGNTRNHPPTVKALYQVMQKNFPGAIHQNTGTQLWKGASLFTADGAPLIGASRTDRLWLNIAHGHQGWAMACGSARLVADLVRGTSPLMDPEPFAPTRPRS